jgi:hypothetical protein
MAKRSELGEKIAGLKKVSLVMHGVFAFVQHDNYLDILTPSLPEHVYAAGNWGLKADTGSEKLLASGATYVLSGVKCGGPPKPQNCLTISQKDSGITSVDPNRSSFCLIRTPFPAAFNVVRTISRDKSDPQLFLGEGVSQNSLENQVYVPITCHLEFDVRNANRVALGGIWTADPNSEHECVHVWAEPAFLTGPNHAEMAFGMLRDMLVGLDLEINPELDSELTVTYFKGDIPEEKTISLQERCRCKARQVEFTKIRNCFSALITD